MQISISFSLRKILKYRKLNQMNNLKKIPGISFALSQRSDGSMKLPSGFKNRKIFLKKNGLDYVEPITPVLEHGNIVKRVQRNDYIVRKCDGIVTNDKDVILSITVADCLPLFIVDPKKEVIGLIHAGWRGLSEGITLNAINLFIKEFGSHPGDIIVAIGPSICRHHFEVGNDVVIKFKDYPEAVISDKGRMFIDLKKVAEIQFKESGIIPKNIETNPDCTFCLEHKYFSYRRDGPKDIEAIVCVLALKNN